MQALRSRCDTTFGILTKLVPKFDNTFNLPDSWESVPHFDLQSPSERMRLCSLLDPCARVTTIQSFCGQMWFLDHLGNTWRPCPDGESPLFIFLRVARIENKGDVRYFYPSLLRFLLTLGNERVVTASEIETLPVSRICLITCIVVYYK